MIWKIFNFVSQKHPINQEHNVFVVLGFQRSGTSLLGQILHTLGVNFGEEIDMKKVDFRNPKGFYENEKIFKVLRSMLNQAGVRDEFGEKSSLDAKGFLKRLGRAFSRVRLQKELSILSKSSSWGLKSFPILFYYLKPYLPKSTKLVGVYRHPLAVAESFMKAWEGGRYSFEQVIELWSKANRDMLYHLSGKD